MRKIPAIVVAGAGSGVGKTSISLGLSRAMKRRGMSVQTFKVGPDFLDPTHLKLASGRPCYNLDGWMQGGEYAKSLFMSRCADADVAIVEGVMGLYDGASPTTHEGSTAEVALLLGAPVLLVVNARGAARTLAAVVKGCMDFEPRLKFAGVVANHAGSEKHVSWLKESLSAAGCAPLAGAISRGALSAIPSRHLGLVTAGESGLGEEQLNALAEAVESAIDIDALLAGAGAVEVADKQSGVGRAETTPVVRIGVAMDEAFHFYYEDTLEALGASGAELVTFSPVRDTGIPEGVSALYLGGGYPEEYARELSANVNMIESVREFAARGGVIYAECGGLMYLCESVDARGEIFEMCGVMPAAVRMLERRKALGYVEVELAEDSQWGNKGARLRGHEFHYSEMEREPVGWEKVYRVVARRGDGERPEGYRQDNVLASYAHLHHASRVGAVDRFINCAAAACRAGGV